MKSPTPSSSSAGGGGSGRDCRLLASTDSPVTDRSGCGAGPVGGGWNGAPEVGPGRPLWLPLGAPEVGAGRPLRLPLGAPEVGAGRPLGAPEVGRPLLWLPLIGPAVKPKEARPGPAGGAGPYSGSGGSAAWRSAPGPPVPAGPALGEPKALQLWESAMSSSSALSRNEFTAGGRR
ncbi:hypothetical protein DMB66_27815 [Actinoplanes sp. ATCC 53533]|nr:hypothetical protein DMB66_27815 [Actinoplanes sp. ATCC 53533]